MDVVGKLDKKIYIEQEQVTQDADGNRTSIWVGVFTRWSEMTYAGGDESEEAKQLVAMNKRQFRIRYTNVSEKMRIRDTSNNLYDIRYIEVVGRNAYMILHSEWRDRIEYAT